MRRRGFGAIEFLDEESPLDYSGMGSPRRVRRLALRDTDAPPPDKNDNYFVRRRAPVSFVPDSVARLVKRGRKFVVTPGVSPGVVAFVDYHLEPDGGVRLDFLTVQRNQRRRGHACKLIDRLYDQHADAPYIDWGDVIDPSMAKLCLRRMGGAKKTRGYFWR